MLTSCSRHAGAFNAEPELYDPPMLQAFISLAHDLCRMFGLPPVATMSQRDVPGLTRSAIPLLKQAGVQVRPRHVWVVFVCVVCFCVCVCLVCLFVSMCVSPVCFACTGCVLAAEHWIVVFLFSESVSHMRCISPLHDRP